MQDIGLAVEKIVDSVAAVRSHHRNPVFGLVQVGVESVFVDRDVQIHNVAVLQRSLVGYSVTNHLIHRSTQRFWIVVVVIRRWISSSFDGFLMDDLIDLISSNPWSDGSSGSIQNLSSQLVDDSHLLDLVLVKNPDVG
ncbi:hypothetical protein OGAPHI_001719 [Ogataea philodendri]|uniref:Uncharacterized protein n=1 Tax=Ogataea philodendri TaxID=1378263 RepID=A0A9P8PA23_9ASCO|nr:uncharacterized protein OGAPHI_001719 [Ogataea philodendri]KAH3667965.1 hypothetical protein OGAPHI_001719 [Ogataea philodendri]